MGKRVEYQIVGRYMDGKEVTAYHLQSLDTGKAGRYTREQVCYLVGRGQVTNCEGQIYKDKLLLRGVNCSLDSLPVQQESGELQRTGSISNIRKNDTGADVMTKLMITQAITDGRNVVGYVVTNTGGGTNNISREQLLELAKAGRIGNARYQTSNGRPILRGVGINLNDLPTVKIQPQAQASTILEEAQATKHETTPKTSKPRIGAMSGSTKSDKKSSIVDAG